MHECFNDTIFLSVAYQLEYTLFSFLFLIFYFIGSILMDLERKLQDDIEFWFPLLPRTPF